MGYLAKLKFNLKRLDEKSSRMSKLTGWLKSECKENFGVDFSIEVEGIKSIEYSGRKAYIITILGLGEMDKGQCDVITNNIFTLKKLKVKDVSYNVFKSSIEKSLANCGNIRYGICLILRDIQKENNPLKEVADKG